MYKNKPVRINRNTKTMIIAVLCVSLGLLIGVGGTLTYHNMQIETLIDDNESRQDELRTEIESLSAELVSLNTDILKLGSSIPEGLEYNNTSMVTTNDYSENIQSVAKAVMPSVVGVRTVTVQTATSYFYGRSTSQEVVGVGTGVIVSEDGLILTNQHVVTDNPKSVTVTLIDGSEYDAEVIYSDESMDLAVIKIEETGLTAASLGNSDRINVGETTIAIGNPLGLEFERSVTAGIVSALDRAIQLDQYEFATNLIQTDAAINSGNSGGPLLNSSGEVIGINTYKLSYGEGMGFAIPINAAIPIIQQVIESGEFTQAKIGANFIDSNVYALLTDSDLADLELSNVDYTNGLLALTVKEESDAYASGLRATDILVSVNGEEVDTLLELRTVLYSKRPGDSVEMSVIRAGETLQIEAVLYSVP